MSKELRKGSKCFNCGTTLLNNENFCPNCGQQNHNKQASTRILLADFLEDYFTFDSKLFRSILPLMTKPGHITKEYLDGKRQQFIAPIRVFIFLSFIYFGISFLIGSNAAGSITINGEAPSSDSGQAFYNAFRNNFNLVVFFFAPVQALIIMAMYRSKERPYYVNYFVYTLHLFSFFFLLGTLITLLSAGLQRISTGETMQYVQLGIALIAFVYIIVYSILSLKRVFNKDYNILRYFIVILMSGFVFVAIMLAFIFLLAFIYSLQTGS